MKLFVFPMLVTAFISLSSCGNNTTTSTTDSTTNDKKMAQANIKEEAVTYKSDTTTLNGYVAYDASNDNKRPVVLVVHEWWGLTDYTRNRAKQLAQLGYIAMAVDMYGHGKTAANPQEAQAFAMPFYQNPQLAKTRLDAALNKMKEFKQADMSRTAAIGYCYGGFVVLNAAKLGADLDGVVSFHGNLSGVPANKDLLKAKILVCHGGSDQFVKPEEVAAFKKSMDSIGADYTFKVYPNATHAFTNPAATALGKKFNMPIAYNGAADTASWKDMKTFFANVLK